MRFYTLDNTPIIQLIVRTLYDISLYLFQAYEVVYCRLNTHYEGDANDVSSSAQPSSTNINHLSGLKYKTSNYSHHKTGFEIPLEILKMYNITDIHKVSFPIKKHESQWDCPTTQLIDKLIVISHLLLAINSSANVIIYMLKGK